MTSKRKKRTFKQVKGATPRLREEEMNKVGMHFFPPLQPKVLSPHCPRCKGQCMMRCLGTERGDCGLPLRATLFPSMTAPPKRCTVCERERRGIHDPLSTEPEPFAALAASVIRQAFVDLQGYRKEGEAKTHAITAVLFLTEKLWETENVWNMILGASLVKRQIFQRVRAIIIDGRTFKTLTSPPEGASHGADDEDH